MQEMTVVWSDLSVALRVPIFLVAGKNRGKEGENGKLSRSYADLIINAKPDFFRSKKLKKASAYCTTPGLF